jgi:tRNA1(Val) A37 N6-methylase TrmN6
LRPRGTLSFILSAASLAEAMTAFGAAGCAPTVLLPLWAKPRQPAKLLLLRGTKGGREPLRVLPGLILHATDGTFTAEIDAILRGRAALEL